MKTEYYLDYLAVYGNIAQEWKRDKFNSKQEAEEFIKKGGNSVQETKIYESIDLKPEYKYEIHYSGVYKTGKKKDETYKACYNAESLDEFVRVYKMHKNETIEFFKVLEKLQ